MIEKKLNPATRIGSFALKMGTWGLLGIPSIVLVAFLTDMTWQFGLGFLVVWYALASIFYIVGFVLYKKIAQDKYDYQHHFVVDEYKLAVRKMSNRKS